MNRSDIAFSSGRGRQSAMAADSEQLDLQTPTRQLAGNQVETRAVTADDDQIGHREFVPDQRDLDLGLIREVRDGWQFYRDRRPDAYDEITAR